MMRFIVVALIAQLLSLGIAALAQAQQDPPDLSGIWSDPPPTPENLLCFMGCTDAGIEYLNALLDDPNNDDRPFRELNREAARFQVDEHTRSYLTASALEGYPVPLAEDPGLTECRPWGFARQILIAHQMEIRQYEDRVEFYYVGWDTLRTVYLDDRKPPEDQLPTRMGHSLGRYEGSALVVETSSIRPGFMQPFTIGMVEHSDQLQVVERYTRSPDGNRLEVDVIYDDPLTFREPFHLMKPWAWAPDEEVYEEWECELDPELTG